MIGHHRGHHDISKREIQCREKKSVCLAQTYDFTEDAMQEQVRIQGGSHQDQGCHHLHPVQSCQRHHPLVQQIWQVHEEGEQRMAIHVIACLPIRQHVIGDGIIARHTEPPDEQFPVVISRTHKQVAILIDGQRVQQGKHQHHRQSQPPFLTTDLEHAQYLSHRFKKNLTNRKFTGTQIQNIGMGAHGLLTPNQRKKFSSIICSNQFTTCDKAKPAPRRTLAFTRKV